MASLQTEDITTDNTTCFPSRTKITAETATTGKLPGSGSFMIQRIEVICVDSCLKGAGHDEENFTPPGHIENGVWHDEKGFPPSYHVVVPAKVGWLIRTFEMVYNSQRYEGFKSSTHSHPFLTKIWIFQSVFHQFAWSLAVLEGDTKDWFLNMKDQDCSPVFFLIQSSLFLVFFQSWDRTFKHWTCSAHPYPHLGMFCGCLGWWLKDSGGQLSDVIGCDM